MTDTTDFFDNAGGNQGAPTAVLKQVNDGVIGEVVRFFETDHYKPGEKDPERNKDGSVRQQLVVVLQTELRNWQGVVTVPLKDKDDPSKGYQDASEDGGERAIYAPQYSNIQGAIGAALRAARAKNPEAQFEVGGRLGVKVVELRNTGKPQPLKVHQAVYEPAKNSSNFFGGQQAEQAPAAPPAQPQNDPWASSPAKQADQPPF